MTGSRADGQRGGEPELVRQLGGRQPSARPTAAGARGWPLECRIEGKGHASRVTLGQSPRMLRAQRIAARGGGARTGEAGRGGACALPALGALGGAGSGRGKSASAGRACPSAAHVSLSLARNACDR